MRREPEVLETETQVRIWLDCRTRITSKELAQLHSVTKYITKSVCSTSPIMNASLEKSALMHTAAQEVSREWWQVQWLYLKHDNWLAYFKIWIRRSLHTFCGRAQTYWNQSDVFNSPKPCYVTQTFETQNHRLEWFEQVILISATPTPQNLRIGLKKRRNGKNDVSVKQVGGWPKISSNSIKENHKTTFFSLEENCCLPAPSTLKPKEREFVVDSRASMHVISKKGFEFRWIGNRDDIEKSDDGNNSQWRSADACESLRGYGSSFIARKALQ